MCMIKQLCFGGKNNFKLCINWHIKGFFFPQETLMLVQIKTLYLRLAMLYCWTLKKYGVCSASPADFCLQIWLMEGGNSPDSSVKATLFKWCSNGQSKQKKVYCHIHSRRFKKTSTCMKYNGILSNSFSTRLPFRCLKMS